MKNIFHLMYVGVNSEDFVSSSFSLQSCCFSSFLSSVCDNHVSHFENVCFFLNL